jgi:ketosteroid isomerase-like protein
MKIPLLSLILVLSVSTALAQPPQPSTDQSEIAAVKQVAQDMGDAMVAVNLEKLTEIFADDWVSVGASGRVLTRDIMLQRFKSGSDRLRSFELGPTDVQVFGNVAISQGSVIESRTRDGREIGGTYVWMDVLKKRNGNWVVVHSSGAKVN